MSSQPDIEFDISKRRVAFKKPRLEDAPDSGFYGKCGNENRNKALIRQFRWIDIYEFEP